MKIRFTKEVLNAVEPSNQRQRIKDAKVEGLVLEVLPSGRKSFRVYKRVKGQKSPVNVTLGQYPSLTIENARKLALSTLEKIAHGINPNEQAKVEAKAQITLHEVFHDYLSQKELSQSSLRGYNQIFNTYLNDWHTTPIANLTETMIKERHSSLSCTSRAQADYCMRVLRALFNFAQFEYKDSQDRPIYLYNPVKILSHKRQWNHVPRKQTRLTHTEIKKLLETLEVMRQETDPFTFAVCDFVEIALFTGLRKSELLCLKWEDVDFNEQTFSLTETKNGEKLELPMSNHLLTIFQRRREHTDNDYVFQAENDYGYIREPKKVIQKIEKQSEVNFTLHDLRRTFTSIAEQLRVGTYTLKRLLNHKTGRNDVTAGYTILTAKELSKATEEISLEMLSM
ncbi:tyrosine-type recombinase/integrase [Marinomonas spartinae]|uniref:tyrosine-type recombinase/integrase n=1 Tax=Marinomonas spartinae TaxID=1792290 RepID=UPI0018F212FC|nr:tyrosine-type recombinase/integrase [Marinomonas spartinae]MBJ7556995.1 tyrosine-type recombinase/integrase [Marinomonas spartinae]